MPRLTKTSRYHTTKRVIDFSRYLRYQEWDAPRFGEVPERIYVVTQRDLDRPDLISWEAYGTVALWWVIMFYNKINDPFSMQVGDRLKIPTITLPGGVGELRDLTLADLPRVPEITAYRPPRFRRTSVVSKSESVEEIRDPLLNFGFPVPEEADGFAHFQIQVSSDPDFSNVLHSLMTQTDVDRWFFYDHLTNNGVGGHVAFPVGGIDADIYQGQSVYYLFQTGDLTKDNVYYVRYRAWVGNLETQWYAPSPIIL